MTISDVRAMTYTELQRWWETDFRVLVTTAIAEATGPVHPTVTAALHDPAWTERWADALYAGSGELASSVERMTYTRDPRLKRVRRQWGTVHQRMGHANALLKTRLGEQGWEMLPAHLKDARLTALSIVAKHHHEETGQLHALELARRGLPAEPPLHGVSYRDVLEAIEGAVHRRMIHAPLTPGVRRLLSAPPHFITQVVARDVTEQQERNPALRHPLLLRPWTQSLVHLRDRHCELAGIVPEFTVSLATLDMRQLRAMGDEEAWVVINRRRFIRALAQRRRECQMHVRQLGRTVAQRTDELRQPWYEAVRAAREELGRRHADEWDALAAAFAPYCEPGTTRIRRGALSIRARTALVRQLKQALTDGRWRTAHAAGWAAVLGDLPDPDRPEEGP